MAEGSICRNCFHSYVCEQFNENKDANNKKCLFFNDHFVPIVDVVEVVRCKDCEFAYICDGKVYCRNIETPWYNDYFEVFTEITDFCSYGSPRERGGER